jgi:V-type H+-transporting ATPase subunit G
MTNLALILEAEKQAASIVSDARQYRVERVKQAKQSALQDVQQLREKLDGEYTAFVQEQQQQLQADLTDIEWESSARQEAIRAKAEQGRRAVVEALVHAVTGLPAETIRPHIGQAEL